MWFNFLRVLTYNYTINHTFLCAQKLIGREVLAYKLLSIGKQQMTYLYLDINGLNTNEQDEEEEQKKKEKKDISSSIKNEVPRHLTVDQKKKLRSLYYRSKMIGKRKVLISLRNIKRNLWKPVYLPGLYILNSDYPVSFYKEYIYFCYRLVKYFNFYYYIYIKLIFAIIWRLRFLEFDTYTFFNFLYTENKIYKLKRVFLLKLLNIKKRKARRFFIKKFRKYKLKRLKHSFKLKSKYKFLFFRKYSFKRSNRFKFKRQFKFNKFRRRFLYLQSRIFKIQRLRRLLIK